MDVYVVSKEFSAPQIGVRLYVSDTVGKISSRTSVLIGTTEYQDKAFYDWVGSQDSLNYLTFVGSIPDPAYGGGSLVKGGSAAITAGSSVVTVTGQAWTGVPLGIVATVVKPVGGANIFATIRSTTITADGFTADISAPGPGAGYVLVFIATLN